MEIGALGWGSSNFALRNHSDDAAGAASASAFAALRISASPKRLSRFRSVFPLRVPRVAIDISQYFLVSKRAGVHGN